MTTRSLGLRRHTSAAVATQRDEPVPYGMHRGLPRRPAGPLRDYGPADKIVEDAPPPADVEFTEAAAESDVVIAGVETPVATPAPAFVDPHPGFFEWYDGELIPMEGHYTARGGARFIDGAPAFLMEDRPVSNIR